MPSSRLSQGFRYRSFQGIVRLCSWRRCGLAWPRNKAPALCQSCFKLAPFKHLLQLTVLCLT